jgi:MFS transporter, MHS family, proline/betaine transporter
MPASREKQVAAAVLGNALEWYDFVVFGMLTVIIADLFFPGDDPYISLLKTTAVFGVGFVMRPIGGLIMGMYADRKGRKAAMQAIIALMTLSLLTIAFAPTYSSIGYGAPALIVFARLLQGFATGGQYAIATSFLVEVAPPGRRGLYGSMTQIGQVLAALGGASAGMFLSVMLTPEQTHAWGWRLPFAVGLLIAPVGVYIARHLEESDAFLDHQKSQVVALPLLTMLGENLRGVLVTFGLVICGTITYYVILIAMPTFAQHQLGIPSGQAFEVQVTALVTLLILTPFAGWLADRFALRPLLMIGSAAMLVVVLPLFHRVHTAPNFANLMLLQVTVCALFAFYFGAVATAVAEQFPAGVRSTGLSLAYNLAVMLFGGFAQTIVAWLTHKTGDPYAAAYYVMFGAAVGFSAACFVRPSEQAHP